MDSTLPLHVIVVDDEADVRELVRVYLERQGMAVSEAACEAELLAAIDAKATDVVLLDVNLGSEDGFAVARRLRARWRGGLLMVTGRADTVDRVVGLEIGADDYVTKPFELRELLARVRSVARRTYAVVAAAPPAVAPEKSRTLRFDGFCLNIDRRELRDSNHALIELTTGEFDLLCALAQQPGVVRNRDQLLRQTHGRDGGPFDRTIDVQIGRLRKKLGDDGKAPTLIKSVRGVGYVLTPRERS